MASYIAGQNELAARKKIQHRSGVKTPGTALKINKHAIATVRLFTHNVQLWAEILFKCILSAHN